MQNDKKKNYKELKTMKTKWKNSLPQVLSRYHFQAACMRD